MRLDLGTDPAVVSVALSLDMDEYAVVGRLHKLWVWANQHTLNGHAKGVTANWLDRFLCSPGFTSALENAGWLRVEPDGVRVPKFDSWNSQGAKRRLDASKRQQKARSTRHASVTKTSQESVTPVTKKCDKSVTRVEESREEKRREKKEEIHLPPLAADEAKPSKPKPPKEPKPAVKSEGQANSVHHQAVEGFCNAWQTRYGEKYPFDGGREGLLIKNLLTRFHHDSSAFAKAVERYMADSDPFYSVNDRHSLAKFAQHLPRWIVDSSKAKAPDPPRIRDIIPR